ncbi:MAG TPA: lactate racemase domain-containing protein, partial [Ktedonobacteraceae bacterium]|nr:lactate racemase domain-containing protein [Ktedonobacteraceae bacterium]
MQGKGSTTQTLSVEDVQQILAEALRTLPQTSQRVLVIIPDGTRTAPIPLFFRLINELLATRTARLDYLIALGTHQPMDETAIAHLVGMSESERMQRYPNVRIYNHHWSDPTALQTIGTITREEAQRLTDGLLAEAVPVTLNRLIFNY